MELHEEQKKVQQAVRHALRHVREDPWLAKKILAQAKGEKPMKKLSSVMLAATLIMAATLAVAIAAGSFLGWNDFFKIFHGTALPKAAQDIMAATEEKTFTVGPAVFTVKQMMADPHMVLAVTQISMTDGGKALVTMSGGQFDAIGANGENGRALAEALGVDAQTSWVDAAKQLKLPLYAARAILEIGEMEEALYNTDGDMMYYSAAELRLDEQESKLETQMRLRISEVDLQTGEEKTPDKKVETITLPVFQPTQTCTYALAQPYEAFGLKLDAVRAELTPLGLYLYTDFTAQTWKTADEFYQAGQITPVWYGKDGKEIPWGAYMSYTVQAEVWPKVTMLGMISADEMPDTLTMALVDGSSRDTQGSRVTLNRQ